MYKVKEIEEKNALARAAALCSQREYCVSQIEEKLVAWGQSTEACERIISKLIEERFIDEARFSRAYALDKMRYNHWGRVKIRQMLRMLGVSNADREAAIAELPDDEYFSILRHLVEQKLPTVKAHSEYELRGKLLRFLTGRGFELDEASSVIDENRLT